VLRIDSVFHRSHVFYIYDDKRRIVTIVFITHRSIHLCKNRSSSTLVRQMNVPTIHRTRTHYRKICLFRAPIVCRGSTHGIISYAVSQPSSPRQNNSSRCIEPKHTAKSEPTVHCGRSSRQNETHGEITHMLTAEYHTRQTVDHVPR
jgi:hypothetical protein